MDLDELLPFSSALALALVLHGEGGMKRLIQALSDMPMIKLKGDRDPIQVGARRAVIAQLCTRIEKSRHEGGGPSRGQRLFTKDEAIVLGTLFFLAMREFGMQDVMASSEKLADGLHERLLHEPMDLAQDEATEEDLTEASEQLSNVIVTQLEYATGELW
jgi:hypothetical protein